MTDVIKMAPRVLFLLLLATAGCGGASDVVVTKHASHVRKLTSLYALASSKLGHAPRDEPEFKKTLATLQVTPEKYNIASIDELFTSERDGQPLVVVYGATPRGSDVVVYEQTGISGKRFIGHRIGKVEEVDEPAFSSLGLAKK